MRDDGGKREMEKKEKEEGADLVVLLHCPLV